MASILNSNQIKSIAVVLFVLHYGYVNVMNTYVKGNMDLLI